MWCGRATEGGSLCCECPGLPGAQGEAGLCGVVVRQSVAACAVDALACLEHKV